MSGDYRSKTDKEREELYEREVIPVVEKYREMANREVGEMSLEERMLELDRQIAASSGAHAELEGSYTRLVESIKNDVCVGTLADDAMRKIRASGPDNCFNDLSTHQRIICANIICYVVSDALRSGAIDALREYKREVMGE